MKKLVLIFLALLVLAMASGANAKARHHDWSNAPFDNDKWHKTGYVQKHGMPFRWHDNREHMMHDNSRMERIYDERMDERFPGLRAYKWHADYERGFYYQGRHIRDAVMFYNDSDELVSVGFMRGDTFVVLRDDDRDYESRDDFFSSWLKVLLIHEIANS